MNQGPGVDAGVNIVGAGLSGALLALLLARSGIPVQVFDKRPDPRRLPEERGRSINLALAARGIRALHRAGVMDRVHEILVPMRARAVHARGAEGAAPALLPYGQREREVVYSVGRGALNRILVDAAAALPGVGLHFGHSCTGIDLASDRLMLRNEQDGSKCDRPLGLTIGADGAGSAARRALQSCGLLSVREDLLDHDYKELTIDREHASGLTPAALHIWPRGGFMLIAMPNPDGSFTATLFLARAGSPGFSELATPDAVQRFFAAEFPDVLARAPDLLAQFAANPQGSMGTIRCQPWGVPGRVLLIGDAAHAIVPFHGQGMNCAFEDCVELDDLLAQSRQVAGGIDTARLCVDFEQCRRPDTEAIAQMALENYAEMRDTVLDPQFQRLKELGLSLERRFPRRFVPRYSMVMFHAGIPYSVAQRRGRVQQEILLQLDRDPGASAEALIESRLDELPVDA